MPQSRRYAILPGALLHAWPSLSPSCKAVSVALAGYMAGDGSGCFPMTSTLGRAAGLKTLRTVRAGLRELATRGLLLIERRPGRSSVYRWNGPPARNDPGTEKQGVRESAGVPPAQEAGGPPPCGAPLTILLNNKNTPPPSGGRAKSKDGFDTWRLWIAVNRELGRRDPARLGPDMGAGKALGKLVESGDLDESDLRSAMEAFLQDHDSFLVKQGHPLRLIGGRINRYLEEDPKSEDLFDPQIAIELERKLAEEARAAGGAS